MRLVRAFRRWWASARLSTLEATSWLVAANIALLVMLLANPSVENLGGWGSKAQEILSGSFPKSNFYPIGSALAVVPFEALGLSPVVAHFFYANVGLFGLYILGSRILEGAYLRSFFLLVLTNVYLFWLLMGTQDTVLEFAVLPWAIWLLMARKPVLFGLLAVALVAVRPGNLVWLGLAVIAMLLASRSWVWLAPVAFLALFAGFNLAVYGSPSPSFNGPMGLYQGQKLGHYLTMPLYDFDVVTGRDRPDGLGGEAVVDERTASGLWMDAALRQIADDPARFVSGSANKTFDYFFHVTKVPRFSTPAYYSEVDGTLEVKYTTPSLARVAAESVYAVGRAATLLLTGFTLVGFTVARPLRTFWSRRENVLLLPILGGAIPAIALTVDTRFAINYEILLTLWSVWGFMVLAPRLRQARGRMQPTRSTD